MPTCRLLNNYERVNLRNRPCPRRPVDVNVLVVPEGSLLVADPSSRVDGPAVNLRVVLVTQSPKASVGGRRVAATRHAPDSLEFVRTWAPEADEAATGMLAACEGIGRGRAGSWLEARPGLVGLMTTLPGRPYNGLYGFDATATAEDAIALAEGLAASGVSWCARLRPGTPAEVDEALREMGLFVEDKAQLMATTGTAHDFEDWRPPELTLRTRQPEDDHAIAEVLGAAFGATPSSAAKLLDPAHLASEGIQWHLGEVDGAPVTCALSVVAGDAVGLFAVGTVPEARGRGYGSAVTSHAVAHGFAAGAGYGVLTASPEVQAVYERLGFRVLESWRRLVPPQ